ncbi:ABC transporter permease [Streptacidiphilus sp. ASG 303]|uniref:ABC transporter permease n=1 Tax=Streptacidiphilus sp. ASG 303 TaxID=2896847 RepID=UPI001E5F9B40|nr:ABC transporter permease [Streptacidiphilus sp. ASG 303]MCD0485974.1 ABC transporter permease [Streptacidiphilus sp. ASG 303]
MSEHIRPAAVAGGPDQGLSPAQLAAKYGLSVSGARPSLPAYVRQLWSRRHFIVAYATARLTAMYTKAKLGQLWQVMTPLLNCAVYYLIFGILLQTGKHTPHFVQFLCIGVFIFTFTQNAVMAGTRSIADNLGLVRALHFPRACLPISFTIIQLQQLLFSMIVLLGIVLFANLPMASWALVLPILILQFVFNAGLALALARVGAKVTDTAQLMPFILRTWMYASGVMFNIANIHVPAWSKTLLDVNPIAVYIDLMRFALLGSVHSDVLPPHVWAWAVGWAVVVGLGGFVYFWKAEEEYGRG